VDDQEVRAVGEREDLQAGGPADATARFTFSATCGQTNPPPHTFPRASTADTQGPCGGELTGAKPAAGRPDSGAGEFIACFYNGWRRHTGLGGVSPVQYEAQVRLDTVSAFRSASMKPDQAHGSPARARSGEQLP
jgi:hypothetical protein